MVSFELLSKVISQATLLASHSWEYGTLSEALLEYYNPEYSIFATNPFPNKTIPHVDPDRIQALRYAREHIRLDSVTLADGNGSAADPVSLGIPALLIGMNTSSYTDAAKRQLDHLQNDVPRMPSGAISSREGYVGLWSNYVYMAAPFIAYYAVLTDDTELLLEAAWQCMLYREALGTVTGVWEHIISVGAGENDPGRWATGDGWAAAGMARVLATLQKSPSPVANEPQSQLTGVIKDILDGAIAADKDPSGLLPNYLDNEKSFPEVSGTALLASAAYRMAVLVPSQFSSNYTNWANAKRRIVGSKINNSTGIVAPAVNPYSWTDPTPITSGSSEGQSFIILLEAAYRDWNKTQNSTLQHYHPVSPALK